MARVKTMGASPITNKIYYGTVNTDKDMWVGNKIDVTRMARSAVAEHLLYLKHNKYAVGLANGNFLIVSCQEVESLPEEFKLNANR